MSEVEKFQGRQVYVDPAELRKLIKQSHAHAAVRVKENRGQENDDMEPFTLVEA